MILFKVCGDCGEEFRPEIDRCSDCGGELEARYDDGAGGLLVPRSSPASRTAQKEPEPPPPQEMREGEHTLFWTQHAADLKPLADRLIDASVSFRLVPRSQVSEGFEIRVQDEDRARALDAVAPLLGDDAAALTAVERAYDQGGYRSCPACGQSLASGVGECPACGLAIASAGGVHPCKACGEPMGPDETRCPTCDR